MDEFLENLRGGGPGGHFQSIFFVVAYLRKISDMFSHGRRPFRESLDIHTFWLGTGLANNASTRWGGGRQRMPRTSWRLGYAPSNDKYCMTYTSNVNCFQLYRYCISYQGRGSNEKRRRKNEQQERKELLEELSMLSTAKNIKNNSLRGECGINLE